MKSPSPEAGARAYVSEPASLRQLAWFDGIEPARIADALSKRRAIAAEEKVCEEALVTLLRRCAACEQEDAAWQIASEIADRVKGRIARTVKLWRLDTPSHVADDVIDDIVSGLYEALFDLSARERFWEIRFWVAFDRKMLKAVQAKRVDLDRYSDPDPSICADGPSAMKPPENGTAAEGGLRDPLTGALVGEALALLSSNERTAFILKHVAHMPEGTTLAAGPLTIAQVLNVSPRTVRNYLRRSEQILENWRRVAQPRSHRTDESSI